MNRLVASLRKRRLWRRVALAAVLALIPAPAPAGAAPEQVLTLSAAWATYRDDNVFKYSVPQLADLGSGLSTYRYGITQPDDVVSRPSLALQWQLDRGDGRRRSIRIRGEGEVHVTNGIANFGELDVTWREHFVGGRRLTLAYAGAPERYLRRLHDDDLVSLPAAERYLDARYNLQGGALAWRHPVLRGAWVEPGYRFERRRHGADFRERDSDFHRIELQTGRDDLPRAGSVRLGVGYVERRARATDSEPVGGEPDLSYRGIKGAVDGRLTLNATGNWTWTPDFAYQLEHRTHTSDRPADRYNHGREDVVQGVEIGLRVSGRGRWGVRGFHRFERSAARLGTTAPLDSEIGSYTLNQTGLSLDLSGELWRRDRGPAARALVALPER